MNLRNDAISLGQLEPCAVPEYAGNPTLRLNSHRTGAFCVVAATAILAMLPGCKRSSPSGPRPAMSVQAVRAVQRDVQVYGDWVATLDGYINAQIQPEVTGYLVKQLYREGSYVKKDQVLFQIDPQTFQATLDQARGQLAQAKAHLALAEINVRRDTPLVEQHAVAQSQLDAETADERQSKAAVQAAEAAVEQAQINLNFTEVHSLTDGIAGIATMQVGNLVAPGTVLTTVSKVNPIKVYFPISEQEYMHFSGLTEKGGKAGATIREHSLELQLELADGTRYPYKGKVIFVDRQIDPETGTIRMVAAFPNPGNILRPGQFGRVHAVTAVNRSAILVPQRAVTELQGTYQVAVVDARNSVSIRKVTVGERVGSMWIIEAGVNPGDEVITEGNAKVQDGMTVNPTNATAWMEENK